MESCPGLRSAAVVAESSESHGSHLIGYFVGESVTADSLGDHLSQRLPAYMVPTSYVELNALPDGERQVGSSGTPPARCAGSIG